jgi:hypothetical protein
MKNLSAVKSVVQYLFDEGLIRDPYPSFTLLRASLTRGYYSAKLDEERIHFVSHSSGFCMTEQADTRLLPDHLSSASNTCLTRKDDDSDRQTQWRGVGCGARQFRLMEFVERVFR